MKMKKNDFIYRQELLDLYTFDDEAINQIGVVPLPVIRKNIMDIPSVDAVPVIRCKNCIHYDMGVCLKIYSDGNVSNDAWQKRNPDDFCSYGEEKCE